MSDSFVRVPPDSTGKRVETKLLNDGVNDVERQVVVVGDSLAVDSLMTVTSSGAVLAQITDRDSSLGALKAGSRVGWFFEAFNGVAVDVVTNWTITNDIGMTDTVASSLLTIATGTTSGNRYTLRSKQGFKGDFDLEVIFTLSQRIANQAFNISVVNAAGTSYARFNMIGTNAAQSGFQSASASNLGLNSTANIAATSVASQKNISRRGNEFTFSDNAINTVSSGRTIRALANSYVPDVDEELFIEIEAINTGTAASNTNFVIYQVYLCADTLMKVGIADILVGGQSANNAGGAVPVYFPTTPSVSISGTAAVSAVGPSAHDSAISGAPLRVSGRAISANYATVTTGDTADLITTLVGALVTKPYSIPEADWSYAAASGGITNTTDVAIATAAGAGLRRYLTGISIQNASATTATEVVIKDGSTIIWRGYLGTQTLLNSAVGLTFPTPIKTTANTALNVACITTGSAVYVNAQGYTAP